MRIARFRAGRRRSSGPRRHLAMEQLETRALMASFYQGPIDASPQEQYMLELVNRMRMNPQAELPLLLNSGDGGVQSSINYFGVDKTILANQWKSLTPVPPLAWNNTLGKHAQSHTQDMYNQDKQFHNDINVLLSDLAADGYHVGFAKDQNGNLISHPDGGYTLALTETVYAMAKSVFYAHAGLAIDWGSDSLGSVGGMQSKLGHRKAIMDFSFKEVGIGILNNVPTKNKSGPVVVTQHFGTQEPVKVGNDYIEYQYVTGVCYNDLDKDGFYDVGEGLPGVSVSASAGDTYSTHTGPSGGYTLKVPPDQYSLSAGGTYVLKGGGAGWWTAGTLPTDVTSQNLKFDFKLYQPNMLASNTGAPQPELPPGQPPFGDFEGAGEDMIIVGPGWEDGMDALVRVRTGESVYVKGTSAHDSIDVAQARDGRATITIEAFHDAERTEPIGDPLVQNVDVAEAIIVDSGAGDDRIVLGFGVECPNVFVHAGDGFDGIIAAGTSSNETARLWPGSLVMTGEGGTLRANGVEDIEILGSGGRDTAMLYDSTGPDHFIAGPGAASLDGDGYRLAVTDFSQIHAFASDDGQPDSAVFEGVAGSRDRFRSWSTGELAEAKMWGVGFFNRAKGFDEIRARASDTTDVAELYDSPGADLYEGFADRGTMSFEDGRTVQAENFRWVFPYASNDGQTDVAHLYDTTADLGTSYATRFVACPSVGKLYAGSNFYHRPKGFDQVVATAVGRDDQAKLYDSPGNDNYEAYADRATMTYQDGTVFQANGFRWMLGYASNDGRTDTARFYDTSADRSSSYATTYIADDGIAKMYQDPVFYAQALGFDAVSAFAVGGDDTARLYDSRLNDNYWSRPDHSRMEYGDATFAEALDFRYMFGYSRYGSDTATLYDNTERGTSRAVAFQGHATWAKLYSSEIYCRTEGFAELRAALHGEDDLVWLFDDPERVDHLMVPFLGDGDHAPAKAKLSNDRRRIYVDDFHTLTAYTSGEFVDVQETDPEYLDQVILEGEWAGERMR